MLQCHWTVCVSCLTSQVITITTVKAYPKMVEITINVMTGNTANAHNMVDLNKFIFIIDKMECNVVINSNDMDHVIDIKNNNYDKECPYQQSIILLTETMTVVIR